MDTINRIQLSTYRPRSVLASSASTKFSKRLVMEVEFYEQPGKAPIPYYKVEWTGGTFGHWSLDAAINRYNDLEAP